RSPAAGRAASSTRPSAPSAPSAPRPRTPSPRARRRRRAPAAWPPCATRSPASARRTSWRACRPSSAPPRRRPSSSPPSTICSTTSSRPSKMRITESRMWQLATDAVGESRDRVAQTGDVLQTGVKVARPSDDLAAWGQGERAAVRKSMSEDRGTAIASARDGLAQTDAALGSISTALTKLTDIGVQAANGTLSASDRAELAAEVAQLRNASLEAANTKALDGSYLFGGTQAAAAPFSQAGAYQGDGVARVVETGEATSAQVTVPGTALTPSNGVDVFNLFA